MRTGWGCWSVCLQKTLILARRTVMARASGGAQGTSATRMAGMVETTRPLCCCARPGRISSSHPKRLLCQTTRPQSTPTTTRTLARAAASAPCSSHRPGRQNPSHPLTCPLPFLRMSTSPLSFTCMCLRALMCMFHAYQHLDVFCCLPHSTSCVGRWKTCAGPR